MKNLETIWSEAAAQGSTLKEYPRPAMVRSRWINLNGMWDYLITDSRILPWQFYENDYFPYDGQILVPFSPEAPLSQVNRQLLPDETLWYSRTIQLPEGCFSREHMRLLLHFGAVDQICSVYIEGKFAGYHKGGYFPFTIDITDFVDEDLVIPILIGVHDFSDTSYHARGKQQLKSGGMFYTAQSGIWQTVWMEIVPDSYIRDIRTTPDLDHDRVRIRVNVASSAITGGAAEKVTSPLETASSRISCTIYEPVYLDEDGVSQELCQHAIVSGILLPGKEASLSIPEEAREYWTPETPWLYPVSLKYGSDCVFTYFALRKCDVQKDQEGTLRFFLNNRPYFQTGVLDQGYWPDGLYTAPDDAAFLHDIRTMKDLGFNMLRKHGKIEADRWYFHCDRLGMLVWQDMPNGGSDYRHWFVTYLATLLNWMRIPVKDTHRHLLSRTDHEGRQEFIDDLRQMVKALYNHPCIVTWVSFNEGWGQFDTKRITGLLHKLDSSRLVDSASGWFDQGCGDVNSLHYYFLGLPRPKSSRVLAISEFGGYSLPLEEHSACKNVYGYRKFTSSQELSEGYSALMEKTIFPSVKDGFSATVYTQLSDIEEEVNGLLTYDRKRTKLNPLVVQKWNAKLKNSLNRPAENKQ